MAIGSRGFIAGFELAGMDGIRVENSDQALSQIMSNLNKPDVALILVSDDVSGPIHDKLTDIRTEKSMPLIYEIPAPGSKKEKVEYRAMLKSILGV